MSKDIGKNIGKKRIAVIAGDGIGKEVMPEGIRVLDAAARKFGIDLHFDHFDFSSWDYCEKHGQMMPGIRRAGRRLMYWSNSRRNSSSEPHSDTWSAIFSGQPTAPK